MLPAFLGQTDRGDDASAKSDVRALITAIENCSAGSNDYTQCDEPSELDATRRSSSAAARARSRSWRASVREYEVRGNGNNGHMFGWRRDATGTRGAHLLAARATAAATPPAPGRQPRRLSSRRGGYPLRVPVSTEGTMLGGRYRVLRHLGSGGMASVLLCRDERLDREVAVKRLHADSPAETRAALPARGQAGRVAQPPEPRLRVRHGHRRRGRADRHGVRGGRGALARAQARPARPRAGGGHGARPRRRRSTTPTSRAWCTAT